MEGYLRFSIFIFLISLNLAKFTYGLLPLEQYHKIWGGEGNTTMNNVIFHQSILLQEQLGQVLPLGDKKKCNANLSKDLFSENGPKSPQLKKK
jgi:hypothetical protein